MQHPESMAFTQATGPEPHVARYKAILAAHPEVRGLFGPDPRTALWTAGVVALQLAMAILVSDLPLWGVLVAAFAVGAFADHALFAVIHDTAHNLVFRRAAANRWMGIFANLPGVVPSAMAFRSYHLLHHRYQGELAWDADLAGPTEARLVGNVWWRKLLWLLGFSLIEGIARPRRLRKVALLDRWGLVNLLVTGGVAALMFWAFGWQAFVYLLASTFFSVGLHPVGGRWIQEHYVVRPGQETYSYYGPLNRLSFDVGYHVEHHDFMRVPWSRLREVRRLAPEFYAPLHAHHSWGRLLLRFIFDPGLSLYSRVVRPDHDEPRAPGAVVEAVQPRAPRTPRAAEAEPRQTAPL